MKRVALLGSGYVGSSLITPFQEAGFTVRASTTTPSKVPELEKVADEVEVLRGNQADELEKFLTDCNGLVITVAPGESKDYRTTYLETAQSVGSFGGKLEFIIYTGSTSVYGDHNGEWVDEETELTPETPQGRILQETEEVLLASGQPVCILRLGGIYGPGRDIRERVKRLSGKTLPGNGSSFTNLIHRDDIVGGILWCQKQGLRGIYNLVNDTHVSRKAFYEQLAQQEGVSGVEWDAEKTSIHAGNKRVSNTKIKQSGYRFLHPSYSQ